MTPIIFTILFSSVVLWVVVKEVRGK